MARLRDSQSQEQSVRSTDAVGRMYSTVHPKNDECFYLRLFFDVSRLPDVPRRLSFFFFLSFEAEHIDCGR